MEEEAAAAGVEVVALRSLGLGFDLACDFRLRFAKPFPGDGGGRLVQLDETNTHDIPFPGGPTIPGVSRDIGCDKGDRTRFRSDVLEFNQVLDSVSIEPYWISPNQIRSWIFLLFFFFSFSL